MKFLLTPAGITNKSIDIVDIAAVSKESWSLRLQGVDILCFGGDDEQYLIKVMRSSGLTNSVTRKSIYGY